MSTSKANKSSVIARLAERKLAGPPKWLPNGVVYETLVGSVAYGVESDTATSALSAVYFKCLNVLILQDNVSPG